MTPSERRAGGLAAAVLVAGVIAALAGERFLARASRR